MPFKKVVTNTATCFCYNLRFQFGVVGIFFWGMQWWYEFLHLTFFYLKTSSEWLSEHVLKTVFSNIEKILCFWKVKNVTFSTLLYFRWKNKWTVLTQVIKKFRWPYNHLQVSKTCWTVVEMSTFSGHLHATALALARILFLFLNLYSTTMQP